MCTQCGGCIAVHMCTMLPVVRHQLLHNPCFDCTGCVAARRLGRCANIITGEDSPLPRVKPFKVRR